MVDESSQKPEGGGGDPPGQRGIAPRETQAEIAQSVPDIPENFLEGLPPEMQGLIVSVLSSRTQISETVSNPILEKVTPEHITSIITNVESDSAREHDADKSRRRYQFAYFLVITAVIAGLMLLFVFSDNRDLILPIVTAVTGLMGGFLAGQRFRL